MRERSLLSFTRYLHALGLMSKTTRDCSIKVCLQLLRDYNLTCLALATRTKDVLKQQKILRTLHEFHIRDKNLNFIRRSFSCQRINCHCLCGRWLFKALVSYVPVLTI